MLGNPILRTDSYKLTHWMQYPEETTGVYSYFESRQGARWDETLFFGLEYLLERYLTRKIQQEDVEEAETLVEAHLGDKSLFNRAGWEQIVDRHGGRLPIKIRAVPEGMVVPVGNVLMTVENTDPTCYWLTNYVETLLTHVWYASTVATLSYHVKQMFKRFLDETAETQDALPFMLHDFGYRGASSEESAGIGGAAHLINFSGTDTLAALVFAQEYYGADLASLAFSVPATEHSIMTALGAAGEIDQLDHMLAAYPTGILSVVADSYDIYRFTEEVGKRRDQILSRDGRFVLRPDSITEADPTPEDLVLTLLNELWSIFGGEVNSKGYKVLDTHIRLLWGDGIEFDGIHKIVTLAKRAGFSVENLVFGMGGGLLQKVNRDTQRFAFKSSAQERGGKWYDVSKTPLDLSKASKAGKLKLVLDQGQLRTVGLYDHGVGADILRPVFDNGNVVNRSTFDQIRARSEGQVV